MSMTNLQTPLRESLDKLEVALTTPIIAGELADWLLELRTLWEDASAQLHAALERDHPRQHQQISKEDQEMFATVEKLQAEDAAIAEESECFGRLLARVAEHAPKFERDEEKIRSHTDALLNTGLALVVRIKKQEVALQTWFIESFTRDRGTGD
jgi:hypothetical protein